MNIFNEVKKEKKIKDVV